MATYLSHGAHCGFCPAFLLSKRIERSGGTAIRAPAGIARAGALSRRFRSAGLGVLPVAVGRSFGNADPLSSWRRKRAQESGRTIDEVKAITRAIPAPRIAAAAPKTLLEVIEKTLDDGMPGRRPGRAFARRDRRRAPTTIGRGIATGRLGPGRCRRRDRPALPAGSPQLLQPREDVGSELAGHGGRCRRRGYAIGVIARAHRDAPCAS